MSAREKTGENDLGAVSANNQPQDAIKRLSPDFHALSLDIQEVMQQAKDPAFMAALMFKLVKEREQTNKILDQINDKFDKVMFELKTSQNHAQTPNQAPVLANAFQVLPEQDQLIMNLLDQKGSVDANGVKQALGYKGLNAACQRLNKLYREGHLKKVQSGKHVVFVATRI